MNSVLRSSYKTMISTAGYSVITLMKMSKIWGHRLSFFSAAHIVTPVLATHITTGELLAITLLRTALYIIVHPMLGIFGLTYYIPSLLGAYHFKKACHSNQRVTTLVGVIVPLVCMGIFMSTPVGAQAWVYTLYWLIPVAITLMPSSNIFLNALASSFITHAVGSIFFILSNPMSATFWLTLMPLVALERCLFAAGITGLYYSVKLLQQAYSQKIVRLAHA